MNRTILIGALTAGASLLIWGLVERPWAPSRVYKIGWEDDSPEMFRGNDGQPTGFTIELVAESARRRGIRLQWVQHNESSEAALRSGQVDLWPLMTITPERVRVLHISSPYLESVGCLLVRGQSTFQRPQDLAKGTVGLRSLPISYVQARALLPEAKLVPIASPRDLLAALCQQRVDAALLEQHEAIAGLMSVACGDQPLRVIPLPGARVRLGIGSTLEAAAAADQLRNEIDSMAAEGRFADLIAKWGYLAGRSESADTLLNARRRQRWTMAAAAVLASLFVIALWQAARALRERNRARQAESSLRESEGRCRAIIETTQEGICTVDADRKITYANERLASMMGYSREELVGQSVDRFVDPSLLERSRQATERRKQGIKEQYDFIFRRKDGSQLHSIVAASPLYDERGNYAGALGMIADITERKQAEEQRSRLEEQLQQAQKLDSIGRLAGGVAHDFNNLLTVINGYADLLLREIKEEDPIRANVAEMRRAGERGAELTRRLLSFSRQQLIDPKPIDLNRLVVDSGNILRRLMGEDVEIVIVPGDSLAWVNADAGQMSQVLLNLAVNARYAMPDGGKFIIETSNVELTASDAEKHHGVTPGRYVLLAVTDTGLGMDEETQRHVFEPFFTTKEVGKGTGLGLSIVYGIVKQNGGSIEVDTQPGQGTTFKISLPQVEKTQPGEEVIEPVAPAFHGSGTILLVEDEEEVRNLAAKVLSSYGYQVLRGSHGREALSLAERHPEPIDLLLTDVIMPGMTGQELAERIKPLRPEMKVLYMSGYSGNVIARHGVLGPGVAYLAKPFTESALAGKVREVLGASGARRTILVVDDDEGVRKLLEQILTAEGYEIVAAANGREAVEIVRGRSIDLVITDLVMPEVEGIETIQALRSERPALKIIAVSGAFGGKFLSAAVKLGASATLLKPIGRDKLVSTVRAVLG